MITRPNKQVYNFGPFLLDPAERLLERDGEVVPLTPKVFDTLVLLIEHHGHLLKKQEMIERLWPDATVEEDNLTQNISALRKALGDDKNRPQYIETIPRQGYRFVAGVCDLREAQDGLTARVTDQPSLPSSEEKADAPEVAFPAPLNASRPAGSGSAARPRRKFPAFLILLFVGLGIVGYVSITLQWPRSVTVSGVRKITILPFKSHSPGDEYLALGFAETLIAGLRNVRTLTVRPTSVIQNYQKTGTDPVTIGRRLGMETALTGDLRRTGDDVAVKISLLRVSDGARLWEENFNGRLENLFELQDRIAGSVPVALGLALTRRENERLRKRYTGSAEALEAYLRGRLHWSDRTQEGLYQSFLFFEQAIDKDSRFALGYASLASAYAFDHQRWPKAAEAARKALELDPTLAEPHAAIGFVRLFWEWNLAEAEREFNRAIALDPTYATAHHWQAIYLAILAGDSNGAVIAITKMQQALELEPLSPVINADLGQVFYFARRYDEAIAACQKALAIDPDFINAHFYLYDIYTQKEMYGEAIEEFFRVAQRPGEISPQAMNALRNAYETEGIRGFWKERIKVLNRHPLDEYRLARYYARLGEKDRAIEWLEKAYESRAFVFIYAKADPVFEELQPDARFQNLMRRLEAIGNRPPASQ